jgi:hypothetical protein
MITIKPRGTLSILSNTSSGIHSHAPLFPRQYDKAIEEYYKSIEECIKNREKRLEITLDNNTKTLL